MHDNDATPRLGALRRITGPSDRFALAQVLARHGGKGSFLVDVDDEPLEIRRYSLTPAGREAVDR